MNYAELLRRLFQVNVDCKMKLGLENCLKLDAALGYPSKRFKTIHVAGTNGKGSVCTKIAKALEHAGQRVGLYTSPHISCFRERIRINGSMIPESSVETLLTWLMDIAKEEKIPATFFELTTLLALQYFAEARVDVAVFETGIGGRLDATNIVNPMLAVITSISLDHTDILGSTIEEIALEKAGIVKPGIPVILGPRVPVEIIKQHVKTSPIVCVKPSDLFLTFNLENNAIARTGLEYLQIPAESIKAGLQSIPPCRIQKGFLQETKVILDVAHNPDGMKHLFEAIGKEFPGLPLNIVCGLSKNKDLKGCATILGKYGQSYYPVEASNGRALPAMQLQEALLQSGVAKSQIHMSSDVREAINSATANYPGIVVVCGTFFIMAEARAAIGIEEPRDPTDMNERY